MWKKRILKETWRQFLTSRKIQTIQRLKQSEIAEVKFPTPSGYITGKWWGALDEEPIISLHGFQDNAGTFDNLAPLLECRSLLALDLPGHGFSTHLPKGRPCYHLDFIICLRRLHRDNGWNKISFLSHSYGSLLSFHYAGLYPDQVERIISLECARAPVSVKDEASLLFYNVDSLNEFTRISSKLDKSARKPVYSKEKMLESMFSGSLESIAFKECEVMMHRGAERLPDGYAFTRDPRLKSFIMDRPLKVDIESAMSRIDSHVLALQASDTYFLEEEDIKFTNKTFELLKKSSNKRIIKKVTLPGTHHFHLNNAELLAPHINEFLKETSH